MARLQPHYYWFPFSVSQWWAIPLQTLVQIPLDFAAADQNATATTVSARALEIAIVNRAAAKAARIVIAAAKNAATAWLATVSIAIRTTASVQQAIARAEHAANLRKL